MTCLDEYEGKNRQFLLLCSNLYDSLVDKTEHLGKISAEAKLAWIELVAGFASMHHPGRFADGAIEDIALEIGSELPRQKNRRFQLSVPGRAASLQKRRVLHVVTFVSPQGGHSRNLLNWITKDEESHHSIVLTRQGSSPPYPALKQAVALSGGTFVKLPALVSTIERARWLRHFAQQHADLVVLHVIPNDVVPIVAFADGCTVPVAFVNNGDHLFWLGSSVADTIVNLREISITANRDFRYTRNDQLLPVPLTESHRHVGHTDARTMLGIPHNQPVLLSVGRSLKYAPSARQNFFRTASKILDRNKEAHLYLVGVMAGDHAASSASAGHERLHFVGPVADATIWQKAADVYLEGFPFGSQTALLESIMPGVPCVRVYSPLSPLLAADDIALTGVVDAPAGEEAYVASASGYLDDRENAARVGDTLRERVLRYHVEETWDIFLRDFYAASLQMKHAPARIPKTSSSVRPVDLAISEFHGARYAGATDPEGVLTGEIHREILGIAYNLRQTGFYQEAFRLVKLANQEKSWDRESIIFAAKLIPHRFLYKKKLHSGKEAR